MEKTIDANVAFCVRPDGALFDPGEPNIDPSLN
jgi:hypothetical protein